MGKSNAKLEFVRDGCVFNGHVRELAGFEDFPAFETFDELGVFFAGHDLHTRVLALSHDSSLLGGMIGMARSHKSRSFAFCR
jgi:hypothetical protein